jgi:endonuclease/exonuclease/phosphatase family metal-dependent hydrolase
LTNLNGIMVHGYADFALKRGVLALVSVTATSGRCVIINKDMTTEYCKEEWYNMIIPSFWKRCSPFLLITAAICILLSTAYPWTAAAVSLENGITVNTRLQVNAGMVDEKPTIRLIHFDQAFSLIWRLNTQGWFPTWELALVSLGNPDVHLGTAMPAPDHAYDITLSYHQATGAVGVAVTDITTNQNIVSYAAAIATGLPLTEPQADGQLLTVVPQYEPVGVKWEVGFLEGGTFLASTALEPDRPVQVRLTAPNPVAGEYRIVMMQNGVEHLLATTIAPTSPTVIDLSAAGLPLGSSTFILQYKHGDLVKELGRKQLTIGKLQGVAPAIVTDFDQRRINLDLALNSDSILSGLTLTLQARLIPLEWQTESKSYVDGEPIIHEIPITIGGVVNHREVITVQLPLPERNALWRADLRLTADPDILVNVSLVNPYFTTGYSDKQLSDGRRFIRIGTYNILGFQGYPEDEAKKELGNLYELKRIEHFVEVISSLQTDILCLQEGANTFLLVEYARRLGVNVATFPTTTYFPGGIFSRFPILEVRPFNIPKTSGVPPFSRHGGAALLDVAGVPLWVVSIHAYPHEETVRVQEAAILADMIDELAQVSPYVIVGGDFNERIDGSLHRVLKERGFVNALEITGPMQPIDHLYVSPNLAGHIRAGWIVTENGFRLGAPGTGTWANSDHIPVLMELALP